MVFDVFLNESGHEEIAVIITVLFPVNQRQSGLSTGINEVISFQMNIMPRISGTLKSERRVINCVRMPITTKKYLIHQKIQGRAAVLFGQFCGIPLLPCLSIRA